METAVKVLVGCEFSGVVREAFRARGHDAYSNDLLPAADSSPYHIQGDVLDAAESGEWDLAVFHPPCTYLCSSGLHWNKRVPGRAELTERALELVIKLLAVRIPRIALENPIGCIGTRVRKPDQTLQPFNFGHDASKPTCIWLKGLKRLKAFGYVKPRWGCSCGNRYPLDLGAENCPLCGGAGVTRRVWANQTPTGQDNTGPHDLRWLERSVTYGGIARAMAEQWG